MSTTSTGRRTRRRLILWAVPVLLLVAGVTAFAVFVANAAGTIKDNAVARPGETAKPPTVPDWEGGVGVLVIGTDQREGQDTGNYGEVGGSRADVIQILHMPADRGSAALVSIPRDTLVDRPTCTRADGTEVEGESRVQINSTLEYGPHCVLDTVNQLSGLGLEHFAVVDFDSVVSVTDAIGGVPVCLESDVVDSHSGLNLTAGEHTIQGAQALSFLRTRHGFSDGSDLGRISAQQVYLASLARVVKSQKVLSDPIALLRIADVVAQNLVVDTALADPSALAGLAGAFDDLDLNDVSLLRLPVRPAFEDRNRVEPEPEATAQLFAALVAGQPVGSANDQEEAPTESDAKSPSTSEPGPAPVTIDTPGQKASAPSCAR